MSRNNRTRALTPAPGKGAAAAQALADDHGTRGVSKGHKVELSATRKRTTRSSAASAVAKA